MTKAISKNGKAADGSEWAFTTYSETDVNRLEEIFSGSDRVAVIVGNAHLEELLKELLHTFLVDDDVVLDNVFNPVQHGTLSTIVDKADMAFLLGLITKDTRDCLKSAARLRNLFAHHSKFQSFNEVVQEKANKKSLDKFKKDSRDFLAIEDTTKFKDDVQEIARLYHTLLYALEVELKAAMLKTEKTKRVEQKSKHARHFYKEVHL